MTDDANDDDGLRVMVTMVSLRSRVFQTMYLPMSMMVMMMGIEDFFERVPDEFCHGSISGDSQFVIRKTAHEADEQRSKRRHNNFTSSRNIHQIPNVGDNLEKGEEGKKDGGRRKDRRKEGEGE